MDHVTRESKYVINLIEPRQQYEDDFAYILRMQKLYNINIWVYRPWVRFGQDVRILVWGDGLTEHCALIKNIETLLARPNKKQHKFYYCDRCTYWFNSQIKSDNHVCSQSFKPEIVCPKTKEITFINEHKRKNINYIMTAYIDCCIVEVATIECKYVIAEHIPISIGYIWQDNFKYYFGLGCIKSFARDL